MKNQIIFLLIFPSFYLMCESNIIQSHPNQISMQSIGNDSHTECIPLSNCSQHLWLLQNRHNIPNMTFPQVLQYLQNQLCGFEGNDPKVRCRTDTQTGDNELILRSVIVLPGAPPPRYN